MNAHRAAPDPISAIQSFEQFESDTLRMLAPPPYVSKYGRVKFCDIDLPGQEFEYIIDGMMSVGDKSIIGGPSGSGKSFLAIHAAMCIARGAEFLGQQVTKTGLVLYQAGEGTKGIKKRLRAYRKHNAIPPDEDVPFDLLTAPIDLYAGDGDANGLIEEANAISRERNIPVVAIFIDTMATAQGAADEISGKDMGIVLGNVAKIQRGTGAHVCLVHHFNAAGTKLRGHTSIYANIDQVLQVTCDPATRIRTAVLAKQKDDEDSLKFRFELMSVEVGTKPNGKPMTSCVILPVGEKDILRKSEEAKGFTLFGEKQTAFRALLEARTKSGQLADSDMEAAGVPPGVVAVHYRSWKEAYLACGPCEQDGAQISDAAVQKRLQRLKNDLVDFKIAGWARPWIWHAGRAVKGFPETFAKTDNLRTFGGQDADSDAPGSWIDDLGDAF